jgi:hypothetical protein
MIAAGTIIAALGLGALVGAQSSGADWAWTDVSAALGGEVSRPAMVANQVLSVQIAPSRTLEWHKCFDCNGQCEGQLDCARLDVGIPSHCWVPRQHTDG